ncbi:DUF11 domain-containing protein [Allosphingosinicella vermicomposti]|uniref:DUF11 domain-containing protein n=1 Tax=Allosphingosinicella vermicomposti TaxID=614671 RepID=UPI000D104368|nr:DUF11 domain-containing protein [Allosphingosinicella vermicomposti]
MRRPFHLSGFIWITLLALLAAFAPAYADANGGYSRIVTNIASLEWDVGDTLVRQWSNRVDLTVRIEEPQNNLKTYRLARGDGAGSSPVSLEGASCKGSGGDVPFRFEGLWSDIPGDAAPVVETKQIRPGEPLLLGVERPDANRNFSAADTVTITFEMDGDREEVTLIETGANTGFFMGAIATRATPPAAVHGDCRMSLHPGSVAPATAATSAGQAPFADAQLNVLIDPYGIVFDSADGAPIDGVTITIFDAVTGQVADVFGDDGVSRYPSVVVSGQRVVDEGGQIYEFPEGEYRFPLMRPGTYRLVFEPPAPYSGPSARTAADMASLLRPDGHPFEIVAGSYGGDILLDDPAPVRVDIPLDRPGGQMQLTKIASSGVAGAGDLVQYRLVVRNPDPTRSTAEITVTDLIPPEMRLRSDTIRLNGEEIGADVAASGRTLILKVPPVAANASATITYALEVRPDAKAGDSVNRASAVDALGNTSNAADATVRITRDTIADKMTIIGRVIDGDCSIDPEKAAGIPGVRVMLEDGSYSVTDEDGRYHFEGVTPGLHVVQMDDLTLPSSHAAVDCAQNSRSAGRAFSRFVEGQGGSLKRVDFHAAKSNTPRAEAAEAAPARPAAMTDAAAAGAERDWLTGRTPGIEWIFPEADHNPRAPVVRVAIKHATGQTVTLFNDGKPVDKVAFDGTQKSGDGTVAVSLWRGIPIQTKAIATKLTAEVRDANGTLVETLKRDVHFAASPMSAQLLRDKSVLVADGVTRPVIALRLTDRQGRPVHHGLVGDFEVPAPYYPAIEADAQQARQLAGLERGQPVWRVIGDEGIAYIELEPTTASGSLSLRFNFRDGDTEREQRVEAWLSPGERPWTVVGLAAGTVGFNKLKDRMEDLGDGKDNDVLTDGRLALYAKGKISGKWLMTLAYDTDKKEDEGRLGGIIDPTAYYTVYADRSERRYDAASVRRLYLKLERPQFYALFGDYETGIDEPELARYVRSLNGVKAEYRSEQMSATAFAADTPTRHRRDEIQGNGLTGPYALGARDILANSERVSIEVRDRERSDRIVSTKLLTRHIDYDIDYQAGILRFKEPILSRSPNLDPQFIVADYEVDGIGGREINAGGRVSVRTADQKLQVSATAIRDEDGQSESMLGGADIRYRPNAATEIRAEIAVSDSKAKDGATGDGGSATAWLVEAEHHGSRIDVLAYAREQEGGFGLGQLNASENGTRKIGIDARARITDALSLTASGWHEDYLASDARRIAGRTLLEYRAGDLSARAGLVFADDRTRDGRTNQSQLLQFGATKRLFDNKLELDAQTELPIGGKNESIDFPAQHRFGARYALSNDIQLIGAYEIADGDKIDARTLRAGFDVKPWAGGRIAITGNLQDIAEYGPRSFAAYGLSQSFVLDEHWSIDFSIDGNKTLRGIDPADVLNPEHPVTSGGFIGGGALTEDFMAITGGATYRADVWSVTGRAEYRDGENDNRYGFTAAALRQIGEGRAVGGALSMFKAKAEGGTETTTANLQLSWAHRPADSEIAFLDKLELRFDEVTGALAGIPGPLGTPLSIIGDARSRRIINHLSLNWSPNGLADDWLSRSEFSLYWSSRYVSDRFGADDIGGWSNVIGLDARYDISDKIDLGLSGSVRGGIGGRAYSYSAGPNIGISPFENGWLSLGYNLVGFYDRDFSDDRYTRAGPYVTIRLKFDQATLQGLGLSR